jgi:hypothetical protein
MIDGLRYAVIPDPERFGKVKVLYATPLPEDHWGVLAPFRTSTWGPQIATVTGEALSLALHGYPKKLRQALGRPPRVRAKMVPLLDRLCRDHPQVNGLCDISGPHCTPSSGKLPQCYEAPTENRGLGMLATAIAQAWDEDRYVFVVEGPEFIIT